MSSGVSSGQSTGVGNSQLSTENYEYANKKCLYNNQDNILYIFDYS